ncbi:choice-of-anchor G family protein [Pseudoclavibacter terrae]|uniref:choice-of-anchor G family protein n=1 Tax=Pseudoclavibacter terrae TaxID=1530195 RepID=UPI00142F04F5|nr:choice-of-anchor G family protein [Pseudoclavibacter terrae]
MDASGRLLSGSLLNTNLNSIAGVAGANVSVAPGTPGNAATTSSPLNVDLLAATLLSLGLRLPVPGAAVGLVNQFAAAAAAGTFTGASGAVADNSGAISTTAGVAGAPQLATVDLSTILSGVTGSPALTALVGAISNLSLSVGAVGNRLNVDARCTENSVPTVRQHEYVLSYLRAVVNTPIVGTLFSALNGNLSIDTAALLTALRAIPVLGPALNGLVGGLLSLSATVTVSNGPLTNQRIPNGVNDPVSIDFGAGNIVVDLAPLVGLPYDGAGNSGLNGRPANTRLFAAPYLPTVSTALFVDALAQALVTALLNTITVDIGISLLGLRVLRIQGTLAAVVNGTATITLAGGLLGLNLGPVLGEIGTAVRNSVVGAVVGLLGTTNVLLDNLFLVLRDVVAITVNAQEVSQTPTNTSTDASALRLSIVPGAAAAGLLDLRLARGSGTTARRTP